MILCFIFAKLKQGRLSYMVQNNLESVWLQLRAYFWCF